MKIAGIVCEYNPMHNGHLFHIDKTRQNGATHILSVMSGNFVQRGETAVMDKFSRASCALKGGADLVIEIPTVYALSSAEFYARGAISIMDSLGCVDEVSFGSECGDKQLLSQTAEAVMNISSTALEERMRKGITYPAALTGLLKEKYGMEIADVVASPNNVLAIEYIKAIRYFKSSIKPYTVSRMGVHHDSFSEKSDISSASFIRYRMREDKEFKKLVPDFIYRSYIENLDSGKISYMRNLDRILLYKLRMISAAELKEVPDVGQGLEYRLKQFDTAASVKELLEQVKTKRYTMARLRRILLNMIIGVKSDDLKILPPYARILAMNERGREILAECSNSKIPVSTSLARLAETGKEAKRFISIEEKASDIYGLSQEKAGSRDDDFRAAVRIEKNEN